MSQKTLEEAVMKKLPSRLSDPQAALAAAVLALGLAGCSGNGSSESTVAVAGDVPIAYAKRVNTLAMT
jgi:threonine dehydrogenase-like Zn-dependent dehydrogenase